MLTISSVAMLLCCPLLSIRWAITNMISDLVQVCHVDNLLCGHAAVLYTALHREVIKVLL